MVKMNVSQFSKIKIHRLNNTKTNMLFMNKMIYRISEKMNNVIKFDKFYYLTQFSLIGLMCLSAYYLILSYNKGDLF
tara:strand:- start:464 stop:694 length:231 start_codon:yes stop_codon:yes gene_type:complete